MPERERHLNVFALVVGRQEDADFVTGTEATTVWNERDAVANLFANGYRREGSAREHRCSRFADGLIHLTQTCAEISCRNVDGMFLFIHVLQHRDEGCVGSRAGRVQLQLDGACDIKIRGKRRRCPLEVRRRETFISACRAPTPALMLVFVLVPSLSLFS